MSQPSNVAQKRWCLNFYTSGYDKSKLKQNKLMREYKQTNAKENFRTYDYNKVESCVYFFAFAFIFALKPLTSQASTVEFRFGESKLFGKAPPHLDPP